MGNLFFYESFAVKHTYGRIGMIGPIHVKQKENSLNGCGANCVISKFQLTHELDLGFKRSNFKLAISQEWDIDME